MGVKLNVAKATVCKLEENVQLSKVIINLETLKKALNRYLDDSELEGEAYESHKTYIQNLQIPVLEGITMLCEELLRANIVYMGIISRYFPLQSIDQDLWESIIIQLMNKYQDLYDTANSFCANNSSDVYGQQCDCPSTQVVDGLYAQIKSVEFMIKYYQNKLIRLENMNEALTGVYFVADNLKEVTLKAVNLLKSVQISENGTYIMDSLDWSSIDELQNAVVAAEILEDIKEELGEELYNALLNGELSEDELESAMERCMGVVANYMGDFKGELGHYEIYLTPNLSIYIESSVTAQGGEDVGLQCETDLINDYDSLIGCCASIGDYEFSHSEEEVGLQYTEQIDDNSTFYSEFTLGLAQVDLECGINSTIIDAEDTGEIGTNVAIGLSLHLTSCISGDDTWQNELVSDLAYAEMAQLDEAVELQLIMPELEESITEFAEALQSESNQTEFDLLDAAQIGIDVYLFVASLVEPTPYTHIPSHTIQTLVNLFAH